YFWLPRFRLAGMVGVAVRSPYVYRRVSEPRAGLCPVGLPVSDIQPRSASNHRNWRAGRKSHAVGHFSLMENTSVNLRVEHPLCVCARFAAAILAMVLLAGASFAQEISPDSYAGLRWRFLGTHRGGRITAVAGVVGEPNIYYAATPNGG